MVGLYNGRITDQYYPYIRPQESGNKTQMYAGQSLPGKMVVVL